MLIFINSDLEADLDKGVGVGEVCFVVPMMPVCYHFFFANLHVSAMVAIYSVAIHVHYV